jgi:hypothetical protein
MNDKDEIEDAGKLYHCPPIEDGILIRNPGAVEVHLHENGVFILFEKPEPVAMRYLMTPELLAEIKRYERGETIDPRVVRSLEAPPRKH